MVFRIAVALLVLNAGVHVLAVVIFLWLGGGTIVDYGGVVIWCSIGLGLLGGAFAGRPNSGGGYEEQIAAMHSSTNFAPHDAADRESALSLGLIVFVAAIFSGCTGYFLTRL